MQIKNKHVLKNNENMKNQIEKELFSERLRTAFESQKRIPTYMELAKRVGVTRGMMSVWVNSGSSMPSVENAKKLSKLLGCSFSWLMAGEGKMHEPPRECIEIAEKIYALSEDRRHLVIDLLTAISQQ